MDNSLSLQSIITSDCDVVVVGAGAAGLMTCLELPSSLKILLLNRNTSNHSSSRWAQGGIAAVTRPNDSIQSHQEDTLNAGAGLCDRDAVQMLVEQAPRCVDRLQALGMDFDRDKHGLSATLEAAHSFRRVLHVQDCTGRALIDVLRDQVENKTNVIHRRGIRVTKLWVEKNRCCGVQVLDGPFLYWIKSRAVVLATGGGGDLYANTTNPAQSSGEGLALAWMAGAALEDLEFVQFHPTALKRPGAPCFLLSEALRGEGARLVDNFGNSPVSHLLKKDLAPRDKVSRALVQVMHRQRVDHVGLDLRPIGLNKLESRFPSIFERCQVLGLNPLSELIPIAPAAHYWMGGIATDLKAATTVNGLFAVGEVACTGLHGANRLASNSLMECLVFASQMSSIKLEDNWKFTNKKLTPISLNPSIHLDHGEDTNSLTQAIADLRKLIWKEAGVDRSRKGMMKALELIRKDYESLSSQPMLSLLGKQNKNICNVLNEQNRMDLNLLLDLNYRQLTSSLMLEACLFRKESRGGHFRSDYQSSMPFWQCHSRQEKGKEIYTRPLRN